MRKEIQMNKELKQTTKQLSITKVKQCLPSGGAKKLKKESLETVLVTVRTVPRPLCFCFFLMVFKVTFFPFFQSIWHLAKQRGKK
jgi:hypothetical protein